MTINDQSLNEQIVRIHGHAARLDYFMREGRTTELFIALSDIEMAAKAAEERLNTMRFKGETK